LQGDETGVFLGEGWTSPFSGPENEGRRNGPRMGLAALARIWAGGDVQRQKSRRTGRRKGERIEDFGNGREGFALDGSCFKTGAAQGNTLHSRESRAWCGRGMAGFPVGEMDPSLGGERKQQGLRAG